KSRLVIASYLDARLIEAEHMISQGDPLFLTILNALRTDETTTVSGMDTVYNAGLGGVAGLAPLHDPAEGPIPVGKTSQDVRLDLLMRERAFWLFFSGKRQGDLR